MQAPGEGQDTPLRAWAVTPGLGVGTTDHRVPFQDSITVLNAVPLGETAPTAVHASADTHDTPFRSLPVPARLGVRTTDQRVPFQDSARVPPGPPCVKPTAMQAAAEAQDTATSSLLLLPKLGLGTSDQRVPSQRSARVTSAPMLFRRWPVAMHMFAETQDTASRKLPPARRFGLCTTDQVRVCAFAGTTPPSNTSPVTTAPAGSHRPASEKRRVRLVDPPITQFKMPMTDPCFEERCRYLNGSDPYYVVSVAGRSARSWS